MAKIDLPCCEARPCIGEDGTLYIYPGDTACIELEVDLYYVCEETAQEKKITLTPNDKVKVCFKDHLGKEVHGFEFTNIQNNTVTICITPEISKKFKKGAPYTYCIHVFKISGNEEEIKTIAYEYKMVVGK